MRVLLHDFSGHPFQAQLARSLSERGHVVMHVECSSYPSGKGSLEDTADGAITFVSIGLDGGFERYRPARRLLDEVRYARRFIARCRGFRPDLVISCNDPLVAKALFGVWARLRRLPWVFWLQDIYSVAMAREAERRSRAGRILGRGMQWIERRLLHDSDAVVAISEDFGAILDDWGIDPGKRTVIENWAPLDEVPVRPRDNAWRAAQELGDRFVYLYAGTLGLKHDPSMLSRLAAADPSAEVVVVSEGLGADQLRAAKADQHLDNLRVLGYQPWESVPDVLAAADVLIVLLEADAGIYSVPSKILTSLCAGRPILASIPASNLGARTIRSAEAGILVAPGEADAFIGAARWLRTNEGERNRMARSARVFAETAFDIQDITDRFEEVLRSAVAEH